MPLYAKLWTDILGDEKLMRAARKGAKHLVFLPWLFAFAKKVDDSGRLSVDGEPAEPDDIAAQIPGATVRQVAACLKELEDIKVLVRDNDGALRLAAWEHRSGAGSKPSDAPESVADRVRKHRLRRKTAASTTGDETLQSEKDTLSETLSVTPDVTRNETPDVTPSNAGETSYARSREEEEEEEKEKELEKEQEEEGKIALHAKRPSTSSGSVASQLVSSAHKAAYRRILERAPSREAWDAEMSARLAGMHGPVLTGEQLGQALLDYVGNGSLDRPNFKHFRGYLDNAARASVAGTTGSAEKPDWQLTDRERFERAAANLKAEEARAKVAHG